METISNIASTATSTVSNLIYGQPAKDNETGGKEPLSGEQGKGTVEEPFDRGNAENPVDTTSSTNTFPDTSKNESSKSNDFLPLHPTLGKASNTESSTETKTGGTHETGMPIVPLNPDVATMSGGKSNTSSTSQTGITDKAGVTDSVWKPTSLDEIKPSGAPGAGPPAPEYTTATPEMNQNSSSSKETPESVQDTPRGTTTTGTHQESSLSKEPVSHEAPEGTSTEKKHSVSQDIDSIIRPTPKAEHSVDDREAESPHSKMEGHTVRQADASKPRGDGEEAQSLVANNSAHRHESSHSPEPASSTGDDEKGEKDAKKMSHLKEKLKNKLHIGSKDK